MADDLARRARAVAAEIETHVCGSRRLDLDAWTAIVESALREAVAAERERAETVCDAIRAEALVNEKIVRRTNAVEASEHWGRGEAAREIARRIRGGEDGGG